MSKKLEGKVASSPAATAASVWQPPSGLRTKALKSSSLAAERKNSTPAVKKIGPNAVGVQGDVYKARRPRQALRRHQMDAGRLDVLFANAGGGEFVPLGQITEAHFDKWFGINVKGLLFTVQKALPLMPNGASIILQRVDRVAKRHAGVQRLQRDEGGRAVVRAILDDGPEGSQDSRERAQPRADRHACYRRNHEERRELRGVQRPTWRAQVPLGRMGQPDEIAKVAVFLASDDSSYVDWRRTVRRRRHDPGMIAGWKCHPEVRRGISALR